MKEVLMGKVAIGQGSPKICVSIVGKDEESCLTQALEIKESQAELIEWRLDYLIPQFSPAQIINLGQKVQEVLGDKPLLLTFRSKVEGGESALKGSAYNQLYLGLLTAKIGQGIDLEGRFGQSSLEPVIKAARQANVAIIISYHNFKETPSQMALVEKILELEEVGGDLAKIAVMPQKASDVLDLLVVTDQLNQRLDSQPLITISMGELGKISRLAGGLVGSAITFGGLRTTSAPGQLMVSELSQWLTPSERK